MMRTLILALPTLSVLFFCTSCVVTPARVRPAPVYVGPTYYARPYPWYHGGYYR